MRSLAALAVAASVAFATPASAAPSATGSPCTITSLNDPTVEGSWTAQVDAALLLTDDANPAVVYAGNVVCLLRVGGFSFGFPGPVATGVAVTSGTVTMSTGEEEAIWLCTQVNIASGPTLYRDAVTGGWSTSAANCWTLAVRTDDGHDG